MDTDDKKTFSRLIHLKRLLMPPAYSYIPANSIPTLGFKSLCPKIAIADALNGS